MKQGAEYSLSSPAGIELVVLFILLLAVEHLAPGGQPFISLAPHPYWAPIILLSVRYGTAAGLTAALVGISLYWLHGLPVRIPEEDYYVYTLRIWREPMLWLLVALVVGEIRLGQIAERNSLASMLRTAEQQRATIARHWSMLAAHVESLERDMATAAEVSIDTALVSFSALRASDPTDLPQAFRAAAETVLGRNSRTAFWRAEGSRAAPFTLDETLSHGPGGLRADASSPPRFHFSDLDGTRVLSITRDADRAALKGAGLLAAPVRSMRDDRLHGVLVVQHIDRERMATTAEAAVSLLCRELASALDQHDVHGAREALQDVRLVS